MTKTAKVCRLGSPTQEIPMDDGATVEELLDAAGLSVADDEEIIIDGDIDRKVDESYVYADGDIVVVAPKSKQG